MNPSGRDKSAVPPPAPNGRPRLARLAPVLLSLLAGSPTAAQTVIAIDGTAALSYNRTTPAGPDDRGLVAEIRPVVTFQTGTPRLAWRANYIFVGQLGLDGNWSNSYSNQLSLALAAALSEFSTLSVTGTVSQGGTAFQLTQGAPSAGTPSIRAQGNPNLVSAVVTEIYSLDLTARLRFEQGLTGTLVAPQYSLADRNASVGGFLRLEYLFPRDGLGLDWNPSVAFLRAAGTDVFFEPYLSVTQSLVAGWNHDFDQGWNTQVGAGAAHVIALTGDNPNAFAPVGTLVARYFSADAGGSLSVNYGPATNLQTATVSQSASITARGTVSFDPLLVRQLSASAGFMRTRPLGSLSENSTSGIGDALQGDVGFVWGLTEMLVANVRYSAAYQFNQPGGLEPSLAQVFLVGLTIHWSNAARMPPMPTPGQRVDRSDAVRF